jgi:pimeloyl-ACP methyl ester carboxylesterase
MLFGGFTLEERVVDGQALRLRLGGDGPPLLLPHGNPQTYTMWHRVAPVLAQRFTVICQKAAPRPLPIGDDSLLWKAWTAPRPSNEACLSAQLRPLLVKCRAAEPLP